MSMSSTPNLGLPLVQAAQAQKHVTVNEALARLDGLGQFVLVSRGLAVPPAVQDGTAWGVAQGAADAWAGQDGRVAVAVNGGWIFVSPQAGWRAFILDEGRSAIHDGTAWRAGQITMTGTGAGMSAGVVEIDHAILPGAVSLTPALIPANAMVVGVTGRVLAAITGTLSAWSLGNPGAAGRYGAGLGLGAGSIVRGVLGTPTAFYSPEALELRATGGDFTGGRVRLAVHFLELTPPSA
jgi:hypothetical protein